MGQAKSRKEAAAREDRAATPEGTPVAFTQEERLALLQLLRASDQQDGRGAKAAANHDERRRRRRARRALFIAPTNIQLIRLGNSASMALGRTIGEDEDARFEGERVQRGRRLYRISEDVRDYLIQQLDVPMPEGLGELLVEVEERLRDLKDGRYQAPSIAEAGGDADYLPADTVTVQFAITTAEHADLRRQADGGDLGIVVRKALGLPATLPEGPGLEREDDEAGED